MAWIIAGPVRIRDVWARPELSTDLRRGHVHVRVELDIADGWDDPLAVEASVDGRTARFEGRGADATVELELGIDAPTLWWPNGIGEQALHDLVVRASVAGSGACACACRTGCAKRSLPPALCIFPC